MFKMTKALLKDTLRTIERTRSRFFSIVAIVALGISFFAGMNATAPDMLDTAGQYLRDTNAMDINLSSTVGLSNDDLATLSTISGVESVVGEKFFDGILKINGQNAVDIDGSQLTVRALALDLDKVAAFSQGQNDPSFLNRPQLIEGTWPTAPDQCVVDRSVLSTPDGFEIGNVISVEGEGADASASLRNTQFTITGIIRSPRYISYERGYTNIGAGKLGTFIYISSENFTSDYFNSFSIKLAGSDNYDPFSSEYKSFVAPFVSYLTSIAQERIDIRVGAIKEKYSAEVNEQEKKYAEAKAEAETALSEGEAKVKEILDLAQNGDKKLAQYKEEYNKKATEASERIDQSKLQHSTQYQKWEEKRDKYNEVKAVVDKYANAETDYKNAQSQYNVANTQVNSLLTTVSYLENLVATTRSAMNQFNAQQDNGVDAMIERFKQSGLVGVEVDKIMSTINSLTAVGTAEEMAAYMEPQLQELEAKLAASKKELSDAKTQLAAKKAELEKAKQLVEKLKEVEAQLTVAESELKEAEKELTSANYDIQFGELETLNQLSDSKNQITNFETNLQLAKEKAKTVEADFAAQKEEINKKLESAKAQLDEAKSFLLNLDSGKWYVQNRDEALLGFEELEQTAARTAALSKVFPWIFFLVAALVCLNTMTRMVEDDRTQLGTLKALGFHSGEIVGKYLIYSLAASAVGSFAGTMLGFAVFPYAISKAYSILFALPAVEIKYRFGYAVPAMIISIGATVLSSYLACYRSLKTSASSLMRPKAPKGGKRIFLEKFPALWKRLSFTTKVTFRNVFRNKKRFIMAVFGVMGCTALMVSAFGLQNSINTMLSRQFTDSNSIVSYDMQVVLNGSYDTNVAVPDALNTVSARSEVAVSTLNYMKATNTGSTNSGKRLETYVMVPENADMFPNYLRLRDADTGKALSLPQNGAVITKKLAKSLGLSVGDSINVFISDSYVVRVPVAAVAENYIFHYVFMTKEVYTALFGANPCYNYIMANFKSPLSGTQKEQLSKELMSEYDITAVSYSEEIQQSFEHILDSLGYVVIILVISAGLLSFIVLYNLSSININERIKEIATIKVLGFRKHEVTAYIFRENLMLSIFGTALGLLLGIALHRMIIAVGEVDILMFARNAGFLSFLYSAVLSMVFSLCVNIVLRRNLERVDIVEALKSIE